MLRLEELSTSEISDGQLLVRLRQGHDDSFAELIRRHRTAAMSVARRALPGDLASAEDAVEDAIAATLRAIRNGSGPAVDFRPYFLAATKTAAMRICGRRLPTSPATDTQSTDQSEFATAESAHEFAVLNECFHRLRPAWRQMLWQVDVDGIPSPAVADQLGVSRRAVDAVCQRARRHLARDYVAHLMPVGAGAAACASLQDQLSDFGLGLASATDAELLQSHLEHCPACAARVEAVRRLPEQLPAVVPPVAVGMWKLLASLFISGGAASLSAVGVAVVVVVTPMVVTDQPAIASRITIDSQAEGPADRSPGDSPATPAPEGQALGSRAATTRTADQGGQSPLTSLLDQKPPAVGLPGVPNLPGVADPDVLLDELGNVVPGVDVAVGPEGVDVSVGDLGVSVQPNVAIDPTTGAVQVSVPLAVTTPITTIAIDAGVNLNSGGAEVNLVTNITVPVVQIPVPTVSIAVTLPTLPPITLPPITLPDLRLF